MKQHVFSLIADYNIAGWNTWYLFIVFSTTLKCFSEIFLLLLNWNTMRDDSSLWGFTVKKSLQNEALKSYLKMHTDGSLLFYKVSNDARGNPHFLHSSSVLSCDYMIHISHANIYSSKKLMNSCCHRKWWFYFFLWKIYFSGFWECSHENSCQIWYFWYILDVAVLLFP